MEKLDINVLIGKNLRRLREDKGLSQGKLAKMISIVPTQISAIENGRAPMGKDYMERICNALGVRPWEFYVEEETPVIQDDVEKQQLKLFREARMLGVAEEVTNYETYWIAKAKGAAVQSSEDNLQKNIKLLRAKRERTRRKKSA